MRAMRILGVSLMSLLLAATSGMAQDRGGFGRGFRSVDPNEFFNMMANGKEVAVRAEITDPNMQRMFDRTAQRMGVTNGQITRAEYLGYAQQRMAERAARGGLGPMGPPAAPATQGVAATAPPSGTGGAPSPAPGGSPDAWSGWAENQFRRLDLNGDGYLNNDEMSEDLRAERDKWDTDHNGLIDLNEFKVYFQARMQQRMAEGGAAGLGAWGDPGTPLPVETPPVEEEDRKPVVYRAGNLPKELPAWFQQLDTDKDGQIGLYEWKVSGRTLKEFQEIDRNNDGFLTVDEVLAYDAKQKSGAASGGTVVAAADGSVSVTPGSLPSPPSGPSGRFGRRRPRDGR